ncbi:MAG: SRPBCC domain-containing protein [Steroidobacteraceae bacterium]
MVTEAEASLKTQMFEIYIRAPAEAIWDAITTPEWTAKYGYRAPCHYELRAGGAYYVKATPEMKQYGVPDTIIDGEVVEAKAPHRLVQSYRWMFTPEQKEEGFTRVTWEIVPTGAGFCRLTITHEAGNAPSMAAAIGSKFNNTGGGGWNWILSDLKSLLETGKTMAA